MGFSVRQDPFKERTAHTKCGLYPRGISLDVASLGSHLERPAGK